ncbi:anti-sigma factor [Mycolicibacterium fortuitum]|nr:anti-sigma factor [Mycolicibacterium fortuitum]
MRQRARRHRTTPGRCFSRGRSPIHDRGAGCAGNYGPPGGIDRSRAAAATARAAVGGGLRTRTAPTAHGALANHRVGGRGGGCHRSGRRRHRRRAAPESAAHDSRAGLRRSRRANGLRAIPTGGTATVVFSRERNAGVLVMNGVTPPQTGTVYQMWLLQEGTATSAGTMDSAAVAPSTTAVLPDLGDASALAFSVEPGVGSTAPTTPIFAELPLQ